MSTDLSHEAVRELLGAYALDAVEPDEHDLIEEHLQTCPACRAEVADHREVASLLAHTGASAPDGLWGRISASLEEPPPPLHLANFPSPAAVPSLTERRERSVGLRAFIGLAAAAVLIVAALGVVVVHQNHRVDQVQQALADVNINKVARKEMADPTSTHVSLTSPDGKMAVPTVVTADGTGYLDSGKLPTLEAGRTYQLWGIRGKLVVSLGIFTAGGDAVPFQTNGPLDALAITEETSGGVVASQNQPVVAGKVV